MSATLDRTLRRLPPTLAARRRPFGSPARSTGANDCRRRRRSAEDHRRARGHHGRVVDRERAVNVLSSGQSWEPRTEGRQEARTSDVCAAAVVLQPLAGSPIRYGDVLPVGDARRAAGERALAHRGVGRGHRGVGRGLSISGQVRLSFQGEAIRCAVLTLIFCTVCRARCPTKPRSAPSLRHPTGGSSAGGAWFAHATSPPVDRSGRFEMQGALSSMNANRRSMRARTLDGSQLLRDFP